MRNGTAVNVVTGDWSFSTYEEASRFVAGSGRSDMKIVSKDAHVTCVPLEALANYTSVFRALEHDGTEPSDPSVVQLFEYTPHRPVPSGD